VRARIEADPVLSEAWNDPSVRQHVASPPVMSDGMDGVLELVRLLLEVPAVQARVQVDSVLRELWRDAAVRQQVLRGGGTP
jgi:hypothetical protein